LRKCRHEFAPRQPYRADTLRGRRISVPQRHQLLADCAGGGAFDLAIARNEREAEWRQHGAAAVLAPGLPLHGGMAADAVDLVDQIPGAFV